VSDFRPEKDNIDDEALRQRLNQELAALLNEPDFQSRQAAIMAQIRAEQRVSPVESQPKRLGWFFNVPTWAGAMAAVLVLVMIGVIFASVSGTVNQAENVVSLSGSPAADSARNAEFSTGGSVPNQPPAAAVAPVTRSTVAATTAPAATTIAPARANFATPATTSLALAPPASSPVPNTTAGAGGGVASNKVILTLPNAVSLLNVTPQQAETFVTALLNAKSAQEKNDLRLNAPNLYNYAISKVTGTNSLQAVTSFINLYASPAYSSRAAVLREDNQVIVRVLVLNSPPSGSQFGVVYLVEPRQAQVLDGAFGANVINVGETLIISALPK
jgi:hypothetical protein